MKRSFSVATVLLVVVGMTSVGASSQRSSTPAVTPSGRLVFERGGDLHLRPDLYVIGVDGTGLRRLARTALYPAVSPNGRRIAFVRGDDIWIMNSDGSRQRRLTSAGSNIMPAWSADGTTLFFAGTRTETASYALFRMRPDGTGRRTLPGQWSCPREPAPSPDGRLLLYTDATESRDANCGPLTGRIRAIDNKGRSVKILTKLTADFVSTLSPAWSPDGHLIAWRNSGIYVTTANGSNLRPVTPLGGAPAWSPDGKWIAFYDAGALRIVRRDGTGLRRVAATSREWGYRPGWLPPASG